MSESPQDPPTNTTSQCQQEILETAPAAIIYIGQDGQINYANERARDKFSIEANTTTSEIAEETFGSLKKINGEPVSEKEHPLTRGIEALDILEDEQFWLHSPDGSEYVVEFETGIIDTEKPTTEGAVVAVRDVTTSFEYSRELCRAKKLLGHSPECTLILDSEGIVEYQNQSPEIVSEFEFPTILDEPLTRYIHPADRDRARDKFEAVTTGDKNRVITKVRLQDNTGDCHWFEIQVIDRSDTELIEGVVVSGRTIEHRTEISSLSQRTSPMFEQIQEMIQEVLETTETEATARVAVNSLEKIFGFALSGIWLADDAGGQLTPVEISDKWQDLQGTQPVYTADEECAPWQVFNENSPKRIDSITSSSEGTPSDSVIESKLIVPIEEFGILIIVSTEPANFSDADVRHVLAWSNTLKSVLRESEKIRNLCDREAALQRERDRLDDFAKIISHDLRNMLNIAEGNLKLAHDSCDCEYLNPVDTALNRMYSIIDDTLTLARQGQTVDEFEPVNVSQLVDSSLDVTETANATIEVEKEICVMGDSNRLAHVFENLCRNAVEHVGPKVTISIGATDDGFYVSDDGDGIPPDDRQKVFESGYTTSSSGTGLGLQIVEQIVEAHDWDISITESAAGGARFEITGVSFVEN